MNIEKIVLEVANELGWSLESSEKFIACCLSKLAEQDVEPVGSIRYRVEKTGHGFWPYCVRAGTGTNELFVGHQKQCTKVANALATAFEDGKFVAQQRTAEACAKVIRGEGIGFADDDEELNRIAAMLDAGEWREYL